MTDTTTLATALHAFTRDAGLLVDGTPAAWDDLTEPQQAPYVSLAEALDSHGTDVVHEVQSAAMKPTIWWRAVRESGDVITVDTDEDAVRAAAGAGDLVQHQYVGVLAEEWRPEDPS